MKDKMEQYIDECVKNGCILKDGKPIKCHICGGTNLEEYDYYYLDGHLIEEYSVKCKECGTKLGHWAYGYWEL